MCITTQNANLPNTYVGAWDINHPQIGYRHILAYQNTPVSLSDQPNCMLLHVPSAEPLKPNDLLDTTGCEWLLQQMASSGALTQGRAAFLPTNHVFEMGIYHIAMLNDLQPEAVQEALMTVPINKRPTISNDFLAFFENYFPGYPLLLCCFNNCQSKNATPIIVHFTPKQPDLFRLNLLDAHGHVPQIGQRQHFDRTLIVGSYRIQEPSEEGRRFDLKNVPARLLPFLPKYGFSQKISMELPNADLLISVEDVANSRPAEVQAHVF